MQKLKLIAYFIITLFLLEGCTKDKPAPDPIISDPTIPEDEIIRIPTVVHVMYAKDEYNISDEKIISQFVVLNQDFRKKNPDYMNTPLEFKDLVADIGIEFVLATKDPDGNLTTGITRTFTTVDGWDGYNPLKDRSTDDLKLFFTNKGGYDAWPVDRYLNIWIAELSDHNGKVGLAGYAQFPGGDPRTDGVVIDPRVFGTIQPLSNVHQFGRTATHEIGHWLNLFHIFGNTFNCESTDSIDDTPTSSNSHIGNPTYPQFSCGHSILFMNFMDYVDDQSMYMFTKGQKVRMRNVFAPTGGRAKLYTNIAK